ncbi:MAG: hypothetical protein L6R40_007245 [Gallowayella cf. fulva]|nr:MAG: hypothetical protein L6R40_007245 [Xanthomendoza cf. fulva]
MSPPRVSSRLGLRPPSSPPILYRAFIVTHPTTFCTPIFSPGPTRKNRWMTAVLEPVLPPLQRMDSTIKTPNGLSLTLLSSAERDRPSRRYQARRIIKTPPDPNPSGSPTTTSGTADTSQTANTSPAGDNSILDTINTWRTAYEKNNLTWSQDMVAAAANSGQLSKGDPDNFHHNNPSNAAEVETPGNDGNGGKDLQGHTPFEISMISWLCEVPTGPVEGLCAFQNSIMNMCVFLTSPVSAVDRLIS